MERKEGRDGSGAILANALALPPSISPRSFHLAAVCRVVVIAADGQKMTADRQSARHFRRRAWGPCTYRVCLNFGIEDPLIHSKVALVSKKIYATSFLCLEIG